MSIANEVEVTCPSCGHKQEMTVWSSVNVTIDEELRERLFNAGHGSNQGSSFSRS